MTEREVFLKTRPETSCASDLLTRSRITFRLAEDQSGSQNTATLHPDGSEERFKELQNKSIQYQVSLHNWSAEDMCDHLFM